MVNNQRQEKQVPPPVILKFWWVYTLKAEWPPNHIIIIWRQNCTFISGVRSLDRQTDGWTDDGTQSIINIMYEMI